MKRSLAGRRLRSLCTGAAQPALMSTSGPVGEHHVRQTARYSEAQARRMRWAAASHSLPVPRSCHPIIVYHAPSGACTPSIQQGTMRMTSSCHANVQDLLLIHPLEVSEVVWAVAVARRRVMDIASAASLRARRRSTTGALPASLCMAEVCWRAFQVSRTHTGRARTGLVGLPEVECDRWARRAQPCPVGSAAWITISYSSFAICSASSISISSPRIPLRPRLLLLSLPCQGCVLIPCLWHANHTPPAVVRWCRRSSDNDGVQANDATPTSPSSINLTTATERAPTRGRPKVP